MQNHEMLPISEEISQELLDVLLEVLHEHGIGIGYSNSERNDFCRHFIRAWTSDQEFTHRWDLTGSDLVACIYIQSRDMYGMRGKLVTLLPMPPHSREEDAFIELENLLNNRMREVLNQHLNTDSAETTEFVMPDHLIRKTLPFPIASISILSFIILVALCAGGISQLLS